MYELLRLKLRQHPAFYQFCLENSEAFWGECTKNMYWGIGLDQQGAQRAGGQTADPLAFPGKNMMGILLRRAFVDHQLSLNSRPPIVVERQAHNENGTYNWYQVQR